MALTRLGSYHAIRMLKGAKVRVGRSLVSNGYPKIYISPKATVSIGDNFRMNNGFSFNAIGRNQPCILSAGPHSRLEIGDNVGMSSTTIICARSVVIGDNVLIGGGVVIYDTDFHSLNVVDRQIRSIDKANALAKEVLIKKGAFIGAHSIILKGVTIGENAIVAAGSVVSKDVPDNEVWGGNPAVRIR